MSSSYVDDHSRGVASKGYSTLDEQYLLTVEVSGGSISITETAFVRVHDLCPTLMCSSSLSYDVDKVMF